MADSGARWARYETLASSPLDGAPERLGHGRVLEPDYARGLRGGEPGDEGRFSEGEEQLPDSPEKRVERRFSEGIERSPTSE